MGAQLRGRGGESACVMNRALAVRCAAGNASAAKWDRNNVYDEEQERNRRAGRRRILRRDVGRAVFDFLGVGEGELLCRRG